MRNTYIMFSNSKVIVISILLTIMIFSIIEQP